MYNGDDSNSITVTNCTVTGNTADSEGGGIANDSQGSGTITVAGCIVTNNIETYQYGSGGGIENYGNSRAPITVSNCVISGNGAGTGGGGVNYVYQGAVVVTNCTCTGNAGGGFLNQDDGSGTITLTNDIVYGDTGSEIADTSGATSSALVTFCDVQGGYAGTNNLNADPLFVSAPYDLYLKPVSPCLGAGTVNGAPATAIDGQTRPAPPSIGAYEESEATTTLSSSLNPSVSGRSVTFLASVWQPGGYPTGTVVFTLDGVAQPPVPLGHYGGGTGMAYYTTSSLSIGSHTLTAAYSGDTNVAPGVSPTLTEVVNPHVNPQYVSPSGSDGNPGTQAAPKLTIQAALNACLSGDLVLIGDGTYTGPGNVDLDCGGQSLGVFSQNGAGPHDYRLRREQRRQPPWLLAERRDQPVHCRSDHPERLRKRRRRGDSELQPGPESPELHPQEQHGDHRRRSLQLHQRQRRGLAGQLHRHRQHDPELLRWISLHGWQWRRH